MLDRRREFVLLPSKRWCISQRYTSAQVGTPVTEVSPEVTPRHTLTTHTLTTHTLTPPGQRPAPTFRTSIVKCNDAVGTNVGKTYSQKHVFFFWEVSHPYLLNL